MKNILWHLAYSIQEKLNLCVSVSYIILGWNSLSYHKREQAVQNRMTVLLLQKRSLCQAHQPRCVQ